MVSIYCNDMVGLVGSENACEPHVLRGWIMHSVAPTSVGAGARISISLAVFPFDLQYTDVENIPLWVRCVFSSTNAMS
jgi:hypothetical protein